MSEIFGFEVEDIKSRKNYVFAKGKTGIDFYNTSIHLPYPNFEMTLTEENFRIAGGTGEYSIQKHYNFLLNKSLNYNKEGIYFIGYVNENFKPIEE